MKKIDFTSISRAIPSWKALVIVLITILILIGVTVPTLSLTGGPDGSGYYYLDNKLPLSPGAPGYNWYDASSGGSAAILDSGDDIIESVPIPFSFTFYGVSYNTIYVDINGIAYFNDYASGESSNKQIGHSNSRHNFISPFWDDLKSIAGASGVYYKTYGSSPNQIFVIEWKDVYVGQESSEPITFEVLLYENSNNIVFQYSDTNFGSGSGHNNGGGATIGIEGPSGNGLEYSLNSPAVNSGIAILLTTSLPGQQDIIAPTTYMTVFGTQGNDDWYISDTTVNLSASDPGPSSGGITTYYTLDTGSRQTYSGNFPVAGDGTHSIIYYSTDAASNSESPKTGYVKIDKTAPTTSISYVGTLGLNDWYTSEVRVTLAGSDVTSGIASTVYSYDGIIWSTYGGAFNVTDDGSDIRLYFRSTDNAGNVGTQGMQAFKIDKAAPTTHISPDIPGWTNVSAVVTLSSDSDMSGVTLTEYRLGGSWIAYAGPFTINSPGVTGVDYRSIDGAGNVEAYKTQSYRIDTAVPSTLCTVTGTSGLNGWYVSQASVNLTATDDRSGVDAILYTLDDDTVHTYSDDFLPGEGDHTLAYWSRDNAGNVEIAHTRPIKVDVSAPTIACTLTGTTGADGWYASEVQVTLDIADALSGVASGEYSLNGTIWVPYTGPFNVSTQDVNSIYYRAADNAGNTASGSRAFDIDSVPPETTCDLTGMPGIQGWFISNVMVSLSATDDISGVYVTQYSFDDGLTWTNFTGIFPVIEGVHTMLYRSVDNAGNVEGYHSIDINVDGCAPWTSCTISGDDNGPRYLPWYSSDASVALTATDTDDAGVYYTEYNLDGAGWVNYTGSAFDVGPGTHTLLFRSVDNAGNVEVNRTELINVDSAPPTTTHTLSGIQGSNGWYLPAVIVNLAAVDLTSGVSNTEYCMDGISWIDYGGAFSFTDIGAYSLYYRSMDNAGNLEGFNRVDFIIGDAPPVVVSTSPANGSLSVALNALVTVTFNERMNPGTINATSIVMRDRFGIVVPGAVTYSGNTATFDPNIDMGYDIWYTVVVSGSVTDASGTPMGDDYVLRFKTTTAPYIPGTYNRQEATPSVSPSPVVEPTVEPSAEPSVEPSASPTPTPVPDWLEGNSFPLYMLMFLLLGIVAIAIAAVYFLVFRKH